MIRKILVYTYGNQDQSRCIEAAARFAAAHGTQLTGLYVMPDVVSYASVYGSYPLNLSQALVDLQKDYAEQARAQFENVIQGFDLNTEWHEVEQYESCPNPSLYADYIFVCKPNTQSSVVFNDMDFVDRLIFETGLPTIVVPHDWSADQFAQHPLLGWKESREAASAVRFALPLMRAAESVNIVNVRRQADADEELIVSAQIGEYLTEHQVTCKYYTERLLEDVDHHASDSLLRHAESHRCDLIIIGGYSHSRLREIVLGGMTRNLLKKSTIPILLAH